jgi:hypothetical protein
MGCIDPPYSPRIIFAACCLGFGFVQSRSSDGEFNLADFCVREGFGAYSEAFRQGFEGSGGVSASRVLRYNRDQKGFEGIALIFGPIWQS